MISSAIGWRCGSLTGSRDVRPPTDAQFEAAEAAVAVDTKWGGAKTFFSGEGLFLLRCSGQGDMLVASYGAIFERDLAAFNDELFAQHFTHALARSCGAPPLLHQLAFVPDGKAHVGPHQRVAAHRFNAVGQLGGVGL